MRPAIGRRKVKLAWIMNENARKASLKKRKTGLVKKVQELTILCDVRACLIVYSADEAEALVWPSQEVARGLFDRFFALPDIERSKKAMNQESYLRDKAGKAHEQLTKNQKKNQEAEMDHLMFLIHNGTRRLTDLSTSEMFALIAYSRDKINLFRKRGELIHQPLRDPPRMPHQLSGGAAATGGEGSSNLLTGNQSHYLMDQWIFDPSRNGNAPLPAAVAQPGIHQPVRMEMMAYHGNPNYIHMGIPIQQYGSFLPGQGSSSNANANVEMNLMSPHNPQGSFHGMPGLALQPPHQRMTNLNPNESNPNIGTSLVPMGLGLPSLGSGSDPQAFLRSQLGPFPSNFMGNDLGMVTRVVGEGSSSKMPIELGLQPLGTDLRLQPHGHGGESSSAGGGLRLQPPGEGSSSAAPEFDMGGPSGANKDPPQ